MGPGHYDADRANSLTQTRVKTTIITNEKARPETFASQSHVGTAGPGQYDDGVRWNSNSKSFTIGEKRTETIKEGVGPGAYSPERADALTKTKVANIDMGKSPSRASFAKPSDVDVSPG